MYCVFTARARGLKERSWQTTERRIQRLWRSSLCQRKLQVKLKLKIASKLVQYQLLLHIYLCFMFLYISMSCPFLSIFIYRSWSRLEALLYGARTPEIQYCVGSTPFLTDWECAWTGWGGEGALAPPSHRPLMICSGVYLRRRMTSRTLVTREMLLG